MANQRQAGQLLILSNLRSMRQTPTRVADVLTSKQAVDFFKWHFLHCSRGSYKLFDVVAVKGKLIIEVCSPP